VKRLILCCDGTWNTAAQEENNLPAPTNVVKFFNLLASVDAQGREQLKYYHPGVGTEGSALSKTAGGIVGDGLDQNIQSGWAWLARFYKPGDSITLIGFSRGAYTVRCIGGMIGRYGLPILERLPHAEAWKRVETAYQRGYMKDEAPSAWLKPEWTWRAAGSVNVDFLGVWDTVGALGIPDDLALLNLFDDPDKWRFYDTTLGKHVLQARHAVAIDEMRASFTPTLWTDAGGVPIPEDSRVKQVWFPGVHCDVGGGYSSCGLSDLALDWMVQEATETGIAFDSTLLGQIRPDPRGVLHDSWKGVFKALRTRPRSIPDLDTAMHYHPAAAERQKTPPISQAPYHRTRKLKVGESASIPVYANLHWNETDLYLEAGATYDFSAEGEWLDGTIPCGPAGMNDGKFHPGELLHVAGTLLGKLEGAWQGLTGNKQADFVLTRRVESAPWFSLIGVVANDGVGGVNPQTDGSATPHQALTLGSGLKGVTIEKPGYFYAYTNDAWHLYGNNRGSVQVTVRRLS